MSLSTYAGLQSSIAGWLHRTDLAANIPDFIALAEARIARDLRLRGQMLSVSLACTPGMREVTLPADHLESQNVSLTAGGLTRNLTYITNETEDVRMPFGLSAGIPAYFAVTGGNMVLSPTPDSAYAAKLDYYARISPLSVTPSNFLLTASPGIYLFGALAEAAPWMMTDERVGLWESKYRAEVDALQSADDRGARGGSALRVRVL